MKYILIAGILSVILGIVHSILGEYLIFKNLRKKGGLIPTKTPHGFRERHLRIIWATWHLASFFGFCFGAILIKISIEHLQSTYIEYIILCITYTMMISGFLVLYATKGKHPGWIVFLLISILLLLG